MPEWVSFRTFKEDFGKDLVERYRKHKDFFD